MFTFKPSGTCAKEISFKIENNIVEAVHFVGGCPGNLIGISNLVKGLEVDTVIERFSNIRCGSKDTSCPDQLASALRLYKAQQLG